MKLHDFNVEIALRRRSVYFTSQVVRISLGVQYRNYTPCLVRWLNSVGHDPLRHETKENRGRSLSMELTSLEHEQN